MCLQIELDVGEEEISELRSERFKLQQEGREPKAKKGAAEGSDEEGGETGANGTTAPADAASDKPDEGSPLPVRVFSG